MMVLSVLCRKLRINITEIIMRRTASCTCGQCSITMEGDPAFVVACNCQGCQTRTGSVFGVGTYFKAAQEQAVAGPFKSFERATDNGKTFTTHFCTNCGTSAYFHAGSLPGMVGVAAGCFTDPSFPSPRNALWVEHKYDWVDFPEAWTLHQAQP
jgi:hypothetical protein